MTVLSVENLTTAFRRNGIWNSVVNDVSFSIDAGETVAIVGESGSGKSVTAMSIMRLLPERTSRVTGTVRLGETDLLSLPERQMQDIRGNDIAMIFQEPMTSLNPVLSVGRQIAESIIRHRGISKTEARAATVRLLERVRIPAASGRFDEYPHQLSGGMLQRIMIAMALACRPKLLIADEPTTALDVTVQAEILQLIKSLQDEENMAVLFITHDMGVVAEIADRTVVMFRSRALETGKTEQIFAQPANVYTKALLSAVPRMGSMEGHDYPATFPLTDTDTGVPSAEREIAGTIPANTPPILEVRNLITRFDIKSGILGRVSGRVHAVENISFDLHEGETLALVGESGCGKSTTGRSVLRLIEPVSGTIRINGQDVRSLTPAALSKQRQHMQMIFQDPFSSLNPRMRVGEAIMEPLVSHGLASTKHARDRATDLLVRVGLQADMAKRFPHEFSGGQRQRISIARALTLNPGLIVADEAVSALDVSIKAQVVNLMMELQEQLKIAYLFISHDMAVVERVSHRVAVMYLGEIVEIGTRAQIFGNPQHAYTKRLLSAVPIADPARRHLRKVVEGGEIGSTVRPVDYVPVVARYAEPAPGHLVKVA
ncbi:putative ABC transporter ATP-binding protein [Agrobacterium rubi TR3 = NBRC 13261]|uniref:Glutathione import ATP-binding protein GsiA n=1 Tax=Agrobacterium rubi TR3 = NBRC 13261 TaxID=1368415 RepID=A0A081D164_9HYPH|nr:ABC transporter ATP-binding protein [Agrobacterium rubi]MBP1880490.1 peptide/nickel transport system ATP-binding protein [Agrobacterium rubi]GAK72660.1 putative ABC transporter ATP-binding protein [Agrobacterium rubi TR3 = NBRC 13261]